VSSCKLLTGRWYADLYAHGYDLEVQSAPPCCTSWLNSLNSLCLTLLHMTYLNHRVPKSQNFTELAINQQIKPYRFDWKWIRLLHNIHKKTLLWQKCSSYFSNMYNCNHQYMSHYSLWIAVGEILHKLFCVVSWNGVETSANQHGAGGVLEHLLKTQLGALTSCREVKEEVLLFPPSATPYCIVWRQTSGLRPCKRTLISVKQMIANDFYRLN